MEKIVMVDLPGQYRRLKSEIDRAMNQVIESGAFINGPEVSSFRENLQSYLNAGHAVTCGNGTDALQIALMALDLKPGDEVITTPFTFIATVEAIALLGLKPVFADVCPRCFNIDARAIEKAVTRKTKVILPVHLYGQCANMDAIMEIAGKHNIYVIEDAAQSLGSEYTFENGLVKKAGTIGHIGCTSFFPSKNLGCFGDGGAILTNTPELAAKMKAITHHGSTVKYYHDMVGVNSRLDTLQAAILDVKLKYLDKFNEARTEAAGYYDRALGDIGNLILPKRLRQSTHIFHAYTVRTPARYRDKLREFLGKRDIPTMIYYPLPMHLQKGYSGYGYQEGDFPVAEELCSTVLSLPMHTELKQDQMEYICAAVHDFFKNNPE
ncbi:MAG: DegT/DnrJ/EryC1/StrS family aminotransferase [Marinilabiliales bacterium]|nr:MAG: DegT/DnrJ/EryC1/StrS family aminotransferase [Marinilabiliales bacterium]